MLKIKENIKIKIKMNDDDIIKANKIHHVLSFEDYKRYNNIKDISNNLDNNEQISLIEKDSNALSKSLNKKKRKSIKLWIAKLCKKTFQLKNIF